MYRNKNKAKLRTLGFVNRVRDAFGMKAVVKLPKGKCSDPEACVLAQAFIHLRGVIRTKVGYRNFTLEFATPKQAAKAAEKLRKLRAGEVTCAEWSTCVYVDKAPTYLGEFIATFDSREYPELIAKAA